MLFFSVYKSDYRRPISSLPVSLKMDIVYSSEALRITCQFTYHLTQDITLMDCQFPEDSYRTYACESMDGLCVSIHVKPCATRNTTPCSVSFLQPATQIPLLWNSLSVFVLNMQPVFNGRGGGSCVEGRKVTEKKTNVRRAVIPLC